MSSFRSLIAFALLLFVATLNASAQITSGSMSGSVVDSSDQVVPGADVIITNEQTGEERRTVTNEVGLFAFPALQPGPYTVRAELAGFRPIEIKGNMILSNNRLAVPPLRLEVGSLAEAVTVTAVGEVVATTQTSHQAILDLKQVENLSIRGRDPISLLKILPGVALLSNDQETFGGSFSTPVPNIQGGRGQTIYVDGINGGDGGGGGAFSAATNMDAIAEVNVQMSAYTAEYGLKGGAQVNIITKHGGAEYHGSGYWYRRHEAMNATNFFNNRAGIPKPQYRYSNLGGTLGGPIPKIPKIHGGNKLFFFYSIDDTQLKDVNPLRRYTVPTALERQGDFSQTRTPAGALVVVRDPVTGLPFNDNKIPLGRIDPVGSAFLNMLPMPNVNGVGYNYEAQEPSIDHPRRQHLTRVDYRPTDRDSLSFRYSSWYTKSVGWNVAGSSARWGLVRQRYDFTTDVGKFDYTRILNTSTILEFTGGIFHSTEAGPPEDDRALAGIQRRTYPALANLQQFAALHNPLGLIPKARWGGLQSSSGTGDCGGGAVNQCSDIFYDNRWPIYGADDASAISLNLTHTRGTHTYKMGIMREREVFGQARAGIFAGEFNFRQDAADPANTGYAFANAFIGHVTEYQESLGRRPDFRKQNTWAWFAQDTWKINRKLTLDYGLRMYLWDYPEQTEASMFGQERFDPAWGGNPPVLYRPVLSGGQRRAQNPRTSEILPVTFVGLIVPGTGYTCGVITPDQPCQINGVVPFENGNYTESGRGFVEKPPIQFDPRVGIAYALNPQTVVRVAGGSFHNATGGSDFRGGPAFEYDKRVLFTDTSSFILGASAASPVPNTAGTVRTDNRRPNTYRFTAALQREIGKNIVADVAYVGDRTKFLTRSVNINQVPAGAQFNPANRDLSVTPTAANPAALPDDFLRPIVGYRDIRMEDASGTGRYDSLQVQLTRRFTGRFEMAGSYTWARGYQNFMCGEGNNTSQCENNNMQSAPNNGGANSYSGNGVPTSANNWRTNIQEHVVVASYMVEIPGGSRVFGNGARWFTDNWRVSGISTFGTGSLLDVTFSTTDNFNFHGGGERCGNNNAPFPVITGDPNENAGRSIDGFFDTSVFKRPAGRGDIGTCSNAVVIGPGWHNHDLSIFKDFPIRGAQTFQFRWEIYNLFNQVQWDAIDRTAQFDPAGNQVDAAFGKPTSARNERRMQLSIRYIF
jgi:hypothetical protein